MPIKNDREYRAFNIEKREKNKEGDEPSYLVAGYASTFEEYTLWEGAGEIWRERIEPTAFDKADMSDVVFLLDHTQGTRTALLSYMLKSRAFIQRRTCQRRPPPAVSMRT